MAEPREEVNSNDGWNDVFRIYYMEVRVKDNDSEHRIHVRPATSNGH